MSYVKVTGDWFPAVVKTPNGGTYAASRLVVGDGVLKVFTIGSDYFVKKVFESKVIASEGNAIQGMTYQTDDGNVSVRKDTGCGCGSILRSFDPWEGSRPTYG